MQYITLREHCWVSAWRLKFPFLLCMRTLLGFLVQGWRRMGVNAPVTIDEQPKLSFSFLYLQHTFGFSGAGLAQNGWWAPK